MLIWKPLPGVQRDRIKKIAAILLLLLIPAFICEFAKDEGNFDHSNWSAFEYAAYILAVYYEAMAFPLVFLWVVLVDGISLDSIFIQVAFFLFFLIDCFIYAVVIERLIAVVKYLKNRRSKMQ
jgi:hypothetical protein